MGKNSFFNYKNSKRLFNYVGNTLLTNRDYHTSQVNYYPVTVRVWYPDQQSVGHVSIQTDKNYISLWPKSGAGKPGIKWLNYQGNLLNSLEEDIIANGNIDDERSTIIPKQPHATIVFNSLDEKSINEEFEKIKSGKLRWVLIGHNKLLLREDVHSCASLASHLLQVGGIENLLEQLPKDIDTSRKTKINKFIHDWVVATPLNVEEVAQLAKQAEDRISSNNDNCIENQGNKDDDLPNLPHP